MKTTRYFDEIRGRPERAAIRGERIARVIAAPEWERTQADGRIRRLGRIEEAGESARGRLPADRGDGLTRTGRKRKGARPRPCLFLGPRLRGDDVRVC